jgi:hypothetical protein
MKAIPVVNTLFCHIRDQAKVISVRDYFVRVCDVKN